MLENLSDIHPENYEEYNFFFIPVSYVDALEYKNRRRNVAPAIYNHKRLSEKNGGKRSNSRPKTAQLALFFGNASSVESTQTQPTLSPQQPRQQRTFHLALPSTSDSPGNWRNYFLLDIFIFLNRRNWN